MAKKNPDLAKSQKQVAMRVNNTESLQGSDDQFASLLNDLGLAPEISGFKPSDEISMDAPEHGPHETEVIELTIASATPTGVIEAAHVVDEVVIEEGDAGTDEYVDFEGAQEAAEKPTRTPRKHYADKVERLKDRMGDKLAEFSVLTASDATAVGTEEGLAAAMAATLELIRKMNSKEKNRASNFMEWLSGKRLRLNAVLERVLRLLETQGYLTTGNEGNVFKDLRSVPYSEASARAMGGNTLGMFEDLKVIVASGKGRFEANPESLLLAKARQLLAKPAAPIVEAAAIDTPPVEAPAAVEAQIEAATPEAEAPKQTTKPKKSRGGKKTAPSVEEAAPAAI